ncbi:prestalk protein-like [Littorina saxatilis]|uniref:prestalk protein-like n=1 Tax=Littorina saxatilis TaxID=31220 RepID=UPI0038B6ADB6
MERPGVPGHLWVLLLIPIALWLTPPVSGAAPGDNCTATPNQCVDHATCSGTPLTCNCDDGYYPDATDCLERIPAGSATSCSNDNTHCVSGSVCDSNDRCRIPAGSATSCSNDNTHCVSGSVCDSNDRCKLDVKTTCDNNANGDNNNLCKSETVCADTGANGYQCRIPAGSTTSCSSDTTHCVSGSVCDSNDLCKLDVKTTCDNNANGDNNNLCKSETVCADTGANGYQCRIPAGSTTSCSSDTTHCVSGSVCDSNDRCKLDVKTTCDNNANGDNNNLCKSETVCADTGANGYQCRIPAGSTTSCSSDTTHCVSGSVCDSNDLCKLDVKTTCDNNANGDNNNLCKSETVCADTGANGYQCRIPAGSATSCSSDTTHCVSGSVCDSNDRCRIPAGSTTSCSNDNTHCVSGSVCDSNDRCRIPAGSTTSCSSDTTHCVSGSVCDSNDRCTFGLL